MTDKNKGDGKFNLRLIIIGIGAVAFIVLVLWLNWYWLHNLIAHDSLNDRGTFGDMFGVSTAFFSGAAFVGIIVTIWMQKEELSLQRQELKDTRQVLADQARQLESQSKTLIAQKDENTFFQMLKLHNELIGNLRREVTGRPDHKGRKAIESIASDFTGALYGECRNTNSFGKMNENITTTYELEHKKYENILGHYFRPLYHIVKFVDESQLENKKKYTNIVRAQLSQPEMVLLYFNCLSDLGRKKFKPLVEKYALLKAINFDELTDFGDEALLKSHYKKGAFA